MARTIVEKEAAVSVHPGVCRPCRQSRSTSAVVQVTETCGSASGRRRRRLFDMIGAGVQLVARRPVDLQRVSSAICRCMPHSRR